MKQVKVFWGEVSVVRTSDGRYAIELDHRRVTLPAGTSLMVPSPELAELIAAEWRGHARGKLLRPDDLPLTQLAATEAERVAPHRQDIAAQLVAVFRSDALLFRDGQTQLGETQTRLFARPRQMFEERFEVALPWEEDLLPPRLSENDQGRVKAKLLESPDFDLTGFSVLAAALSSVILAVNLLYGDLSTEEALDCAFVEENAQMARWGRDAERDLAQSKCRRDIENVLTYCRLSRSKVSEPHST